MYKERAGLQSDLISLVGRLGNFPLDQLLIAPEVFLTYNDTIVRQYLDQMRIEKSLVIIGTADVERDQILEKIQFKSMPSSQRSPRTDSNR